MTCPDDPREENATMSDKYLWLVFVALAGLSWGVYVPVIFYGGNELGRAANARLMAILCVGIAYFVIGVLFPLALFLSGQFPWPNFTTTGLVFSGLAGVSGAVGAICVIFATQAAITAAQTTREFQDTDAEVKSLTAELQAHPEQAAEIKPRLAQLTEERTGVMGRYRLFIAPLIFGLAPVINTLVSLLWHPGKNDPFHFSFTMPHPLLWVGIVLVGLGAALVLYSKELGEGGPKPATPPAKVDGTPAAHPQTSPESKP
jgi:hypothetical protein